VSDFLSDESLLPGEKNAGHENTGWALNLSAAEWNLLRDAMLVLRSVSYRGQWEDLQGAVAVAGGVAAVTNEVYGDTDFPDVFMRHDQNDLLYWKLQTSHTWDITTAIKFHLHIIPMANPAAAQVIRFDGSYAWFQRGKRTPLFTAWTPFAVSHTVNPGDLEVPAIVNLFSATPPEDIGPSDFLRIRVRRPGAADAADTYTTSKGSGTAAANVCIDSADAHYQRNAPGTVPEY
jgi:hypothetical protein